MFPIASNTDDPGITYVDDVFSTYLSTGNNAVQTITNGIDLAGNGGLVWLANRDHDGHFLFDTVRGATTGNAKYLSTTADYAQGSAFLNAINVTNSGFSLNSNANEPGWINYLGSLNVYWTFRKAAKFFDVVTYTGGKAIGDTVPHNLGVASFIIITKRVDAVEDWAVNYVNQSGTYPWDHTGATLNSTAISRSPANGTSWATSTTFKPYLLANASNNANATNTSGGTYIAYLFAHDPSPGGIIRCGSYTGNGSATGPVISLGWEPQFLMIKNATGTGSWQIIDNMRGMPVGTSDAALQANSLTAETAVDYVSPTATGFQVTSTSSEVNTSAATYIYMAIRRPNKPPTSGTQVFMPTIQTAGGMVTAGFPVDLSITKDKGAGNNTPTYFIDRLRGDLTSFYKWLTATSTAAETSGTGFGFGLDNNTGFKDSIFAGGLGRSYWNFKRAPGFFDVVCYTGNGTTLTVSHNLTVAPQLMIVKGRSIAQDWEVYSVTLGNNYALRLHQAYGIDAIGTFPYWNNTTPTSTNFVVDDSGNPRVTNGSGHTYVAYLFATLAGVSKVGSYTGNGSSQTINCGFAAGARFVLIKRTDTAGDWYVWDTARGISTNNDPHLSLNSLANEVTTDDSIDPESPGFVVNQVAATNINVTSATYIFLAIS